MVCNASIEILRQDVARVAGRNNNTGAININNPVETVMDETNKILIRLEERYLNLSNMVLFLQGKVQTSQ